MSMPAMIFTRDVNGACPDLGSAITLRREPSTRMRTRTSSGSGSMWMSVAPRRMAVLRIWCTADTAPASVPVDSSSAGAVVISVSNPSRASTALASLHVDASRRRICVSGATTTSRRMPLYRRCRCRRTSSRPTTSTGSAAANRRVLSRIDRGSTSARLATGCGIERASCGSISSCERSTGLSPWLCARAAARVISVTRSSSSRMRPIRRRRRGGSAAWTARQCCRSAGEIAPQETRMSPILRLLTSFSLRDGATHSTPAVTWRARWQEACRVPGEVP